jgi:5-methylcytosine-specific restriction endonuclease McrA
MRPDVQLRDQKYRQDYRETHREQIRDYNAKYKQTHAEQVRTDNAARRLRKLNVSSHMSQDDKALSIAYRKLIKNDVCFYCGQAKELMDDDHWIPLSRGGTDHWWNLVRACSKCNNRKNNKCGEHFINGETCNC